MQHLILTAPLLGKILPCFTDEEAEPDMGVEAGTPYLNPNLFAPGLIVGAQETRRKMPSSIGGDVLDFGPRIWGTNYYLGLQDVVGVRPCSVLFRPQMWRGMWEGLLRWG